MLDPLYNAFGAVLAFFYAIIPNEGVAIILLTITVMIVLFPLTAKSSRSMLALQRLQPEIKTLQQRLVDQNKEHQQDLMLYTHQMASVQRENIDLKHDMEILRKEHEAQHRGHEEKH